MKAWNLSPAVQVAVWSIQALLADDKPRTFEEIRQELGAEAEAALDALQAEGKVEKVKFDHKHLGPVTFWKRKARRQ